MQRFRESAADSGRALQMDTCKIGPGCYQYTAVDDCTRIRVLALYPRRTAANTLLFLERVIEELPFPVQCIQTDRGREFLATRCNTGTGSTGFDFDRLNPLHP